MRSWPGGLAQGCRGGVRRERGERSDVFITSHGSAQCYRRVCSGQKKEARRKTRLFLVKHGAERGAMLSGPLGCYVAVVHWFAEHTGVPAGQAPQAAPLRQ